MIERVRDRLPPRARSLARRAWTIGGERLREPLMRRRDARQVGEASRSGALRLNMGSSASFLDGWINCDISRDVEGRIVRVDVTEPWPFPDGSVQAINSEHLIEHLPRETISTYFEEAFRVLAPGGVIRTSTPNLEGIAGAVLAREPATLETHREHGYEAHTHGDLANNYFYMWDHRCIYDFAMLERLLLDAGFSEPERASFGKSRHAVLDGIDRHDPEGLADLVIAVDAVKPG